MNEKYVKVDDIVEYCNTYSACLQNKGQGVAQAALRRVQEFAKENAADVQPVKHGRWSECYTDSHHYSGICTVCGKASIRSIKENPLEYCPKCGAKMDGDTECQ